MLNADDQYTPTSVYRLRQAVRQRRPTVIWVGAGASRWAGLPSWHDSARRMRRAFAKSSPNFRDDLAESHMAAKAYPDLFELCKNADSSLFNRVLVEQFNSPNPEQLYTQFIEGLKRAAPVQVVTTNVDLCLEQHLGPIDVIERTDLERCKDSILNGGPFVAKLHGSVSSVASAVFARSDYQEIMEREEYMAAVRSIFSVASVIFLGYGLKDDYVLNLIAQNEGEHRLFGDGPHFLVTDSPAPPKNGVQCIGYKTLQHQDHRAALTVLDVIEQEKNCRVIEVEVAATAMTVSSPAEKSGFYISDFRPSGTYMSGQALELNNPEERRMNALIGLGFAQGELPSTETVAFHDLVVGLICFDRVFMPLDSLAPMHERATSEVFWALMDNGAVTFIDIIHSPFFVSTPEELIGDITVVRIQDPSQTETRSSMSVIRKMIKPAPGREDEGEKRIEGLASRVVSFEDSDTLNLAGMVRDALLLPRVSQLLGYSDYAVPSKIPRWLAYPTLRLAHLVQTGLICNQLKIRASRVPFGCVSLLNGAFSVKPAEQTVFDYASFVMAGAFGSNLSTYVERNPQSLMGVIKFRESVEGEALRREVSDRLDANDGKEFSAAVEGSLKRAISPMVLQAARNRFSTLMKAANPRASVDAVWGDSNTGDPSLRLWRDQSRQHLLGEAQVRGVKPESPCLCGSGDRLRDCCMRPLR